MALTQDITHLDNSAVKLTFTYSPEDLRAKYDEILRDFVKNLQIKGFRKGKAPVSVLERKLGKALQDDVLSTIIGNTVTDALKSEDFPKDAVPLPYSDPQVEGEPKLELENGLVFSVKYDTFPTVTVQKWEGLEVEVDDADVTDADVDRELEVVRGRNAIVMDKEDGETAAKGDVVTIGYCELGEDGEEIGGARREDFTFTLGSGRNIYKFDDEIEGMKKGDTRDIEKSYPEDFEYTELAGKTKKIRVTLTALKRKDLPSDDELAQDVDENFKNIADLRRSIRENLVKSLEARLYRQKVDNLLEAIAAQNPVDVPESMVKQEMFSMIHRIYGRGMTDETLWKIIDDMPENSELKEQAVKKLKPSLVVGKLMTDLNIEVLEEDMEKMYGQLVEEGGQTMDEIRDFFNNNDESRATLEEDIKQRKILALLLEKNTIKTRKKVNFLDIFPENS
ncbi:MAG: trigger factor [Spirochaetaceae bacterium]|nr:trigger factor [Spirochaetaceae bacterium]